MDLFRIRADLIIFVAKIRGKYNPKPCIKALSREGTTRVVFEDAKKKEGEPRGRNQRK